MCSRAKLDLIIEGQPPNKLKAGDPYQIPAGVVHDAKVIGDKPVKGSWHLCGQGRAAGQAGPLTSRLGGSRPRYRSSPDSSGPDRIDPASGRAASQTGFRGVSPAKSRVSMPALCLTGWRFLPRNRLLAGRFRPALRFATRGLVPELSGMDLSAPGIPAAQEGAFPQNSNL